MSKQGVELLSNIPIPEVGGWTHYNTGVFGSGHHHELESTQTPTLNQFEQIAARALQQYLERHDHVTLVDLGAMCGLSATIIAYIFAEYIQQSRLAIVATQQEPQYTRENILSEAKRRLLLQEMHATLRSIKRTELRANEIHALDSALHNTQLFLLPGELDFMNAHSHLVHFIPGVNSEQLPEVLQSTLQIETIHFLHEFNAGLTFADNKRATATAISESLSQDGIILSTIKWHQHPDSDAFRILESNGLTAHDLNIPTSARNLSYTLFSTFDSPNVRY